MTACVLNVVSSLAGRAWQMRAAKESQIEQLAAAHDISPTVARILAARGVSTEDAASFLNPRLRDLLPDPSSLADMDEAVQCLAEAIGARRKLAICGDYDADGITAAALIKKYLQTLGCDVQVYLPDRMRDGYGLNVAALEQIKEAGRNPVITVDCGAKDFEALAHARDLGLDVVVLDHHPTDRRPPARAFVNPNGPSDYSGLNMLTAVGVGFMFLVALNRVLRDSKPTPDLMQWLDIVALGTICDVAPLIGLNRALVVRGLDVLARGGNMGLAALARISGLRGKPNVETFSFLLGPRINAAGRIGQADAALNLLTCEDQQQADDLAQQLNLLNRQRQALEAKIVNEALARLLAQEKKACLPEGLVIAAQGWHPGVIGIVAARLRERYERPVAVIALNAEQGTGSARSDSTNGVDLGEIMTQAQERGLLLRGGGHRQAAGFSIAHDQVEAFSRFFAEACAARKSNQAAALEVDVVLDISAATRALYEDFEVAFPFGQGNPHPCVVFTDARLMHIRASAAGHLRCQFQPVGGGRAVEAVAFRQANTAFGAALQNHIGEVFHLAGRLRPAWSNLAGGTEILLEDAVRSSAFGVEAA